MALVYEKFDLSETQVAKLKRAWKANDDEVVFEVEASQIGHGDQVIGITPTTKKRMLKNKSQVGASGRKKGTRIMISKTNIRKSLKELGFPTKKKAKTVSSTTGGSIFNSPFNIALDSLTKDIRHAAKNKREAEKGAKLLYDIAVSIPEKERILGFMKNLEKLGSGEQTGGIIPILIAAAEAVASWAAKKSLEEAQKRTLNRAATKGEISIHEKNCKRQNRYAKKNFGKLAPGCEQYGTGKAEVLKFKDVALSLDELV